MLEKGNLSTGSSVYRGAHLKCHSISLYSIGVVKIASKLVARSEKRKEHDPSLFIFPKSRLRFAILRHESWRTQYTLSEALTASALPADSL